MNDTNSAREAARRLYKRVSYQDGPLSSYQLSSLLTQTYEILKIPFNPTQNDIKLYEQVLDADKDGKVTLKDLQARAIEYLSNNSVVSSLSGSSSSQTYKKVDIQTTSQKVGNEYSSYSQSQTSYTQMSSSQPNYSEYSNQNNYASKQLEEPAYSFKYKPSFQPSKPETNPASLSGFGNDTVYTYEKNSVFSQSGYDSNPGQSSSQRSFQPNYPSSSQPDYTSSYVTKSHNMQSSNTAPYQPQPSSSYQPQQYESGQQRPYSETVRQYIAVVSKVFMNYADSQYTVTEDEVPGLLADTYAVLGREGYEPSPEDVQTWMKLCDVNQDGRVEYQEYEYFVVKSLERSGLDLYQ